ncbi:thiamine-phosphate kinase [Chloroflexota bacterium]
MKVSELGEFGLIDLLAEMVSGLQNQQLKPWRQLILGIGDDAAAWNGDASIQLAAIDSLVQDVHFSSDTTPWRELGWKALAVNLSDIAAMGGVPRYALAALALPASTEVDDVVDLYKGMIELAKRFEVAIVGGDTSRSPVASITIAVLGSTMNLDKQILTRSAANPGDQIAVTGYLGSAIAGLKMLIGHLEFSRETAAYLRESFLRPLPRVNEGQTLIKQGVKTAIDISDGLVADLTHICKASQVGAWVDIERLPIHPAVRDNFGDKSLELALSGGEDYELLFTARPEVIAGVKGVTSCPVTVIGEITGIGVGEVDLVDINGISFGLPDTGWEHFKER